MCHECPECGQMCYCDGDDTFMDTGSEECLMGHGAQYGCIEPDGTDLRADDDYEDDDAEDIAAALPREAGEGLNPIHWTRWAVIGPDGECRRVCLTEGIAHDTACGDEDVEEVAVYPVDAQVMVVPREAGEAVAWCVLKANGKVKRAGFDSDSLRSREAAETAVRVLNDPQFDRPDVDDEDRAMLGAGIASERPYRAVPLYAHPAPAAPMPEVTEEDVAWLRGEIRYAELHDDPIGAAHFRRNLALLEWAAVMKRGAK